MDIKDLYKESKSKGNRKGCLDVRKSAVRGRKREIFGKLSRKTVDLYLFSTRRKILARDSGEGLKHASID